MKSDLLATLEMVPIKGWRKARVEFTGGALVISVPPDCVELTMEKAEVLKNPSRDIEKAIDRPIGGRDFGEIIRSKGKSASDLRVAITVSDITRPVPYRGRNGILPPLLKKLQAQGVQRQNILIIVGTGTHRASTPQEKSRYAGERNCIVLCHSRPRLRRPGLAGLCGQDAHGNRGLLE